MLVNERRRSRRRVVGDDDGYGGASTLSLPAHDKLSSESLLQLELLTAKLHADYHNGVDYSPHTLPSSQPTSFFSTKLLQEIEQAFQQIQESCDAEAPGVLCDIANVIQ